MARKKPEHTPGGLCPYVRFTTPDGSPPPALHRRDIQGAPYNPRTITDKERKKLLRNIKTRGLLNSLVWNRRSGNLVSGHQRLTILDALMGTDDYTIPVDVVDLSDKEEREQNIFFNNAAAQGSFDLDKLEALFPEVDIEETGFDLSDVVEGMGEEALAGNNEAMQKLADALRATQQAHEDIKKGSADREDNTFYRVLVFRGRKQADEYAEAVGEPGAVFLRGDVSMELVQKAQRKTETADDGAQET